MYGTWIFQLKCKFSRKKKNKTLDVYDFTEKFYQASKFYQEFIS